MKQKITKACNWLCFFIYNRIAALLLGLDDKKVLFLSESHLRLDGNLKAVHDFLEGKDYEIKVHVKADRRQGDSLAKKLAIWRDLTTAKYIFLDDFYGLTSVMKLRKGQELVQLWHGSGAFKKFGFSRMNTGDAMTGINPGYRKYTRVTVTSEPARECFAEAFDIPVERVHALGSPRTDMFFDEAAKADIKERIYADYPKLRDKKIVLIAPTYRGRKVEDAHYDFDALNLGELAADLGDEYRIITKWHPALYNNIRRGLCGDNAWADGVLDLSGYSDINDLLLITDVMVTDYSSVIFDYFLMDKPVVYFIYDRDDYSENRGLYFDFEDYLYGETASNYDELLEAVKRGELCVDKRDAFREKFMSACDGGSTERICNWVFGEE